MLGSRVPRVYTPPLRPLEPRSPSTERWTLGYDVIDWAWEVLGIRLHPWQEWLLIHLLELLEDGSLRFRYAVVLVARQNGKSTISQILALWFMVEWEWPLVLGTAQDLDVAEEIWAAVVDWVEGVDDDGEPLHPELYALRKDVVRVNGKKALLLKNRAKSRYKVKAANRRAGRGLSGNLILLDELREHTSFAAWAAITYTTMARTEALVLGLSNAGDASSVVLRHLRVQAHAALGDPDGIAAAEEGHDAGVTEWDLEAAREILEQGTDDDGDDGVDPEGLDDLDPEDLDADPDTIFLAEWSATPGCDLWDRTEWAWSNPSLNHDNGIRERALAAAAKADSVSFRVEGLCQWLDGSVNGPFPPGAWEKGLNTPVKAADGSLSVAASDKIVGPTAAAVAMSPDRSHAWIAVAGYRADGQAQAEIVARRAGVDWVPRWLADNAAKFGIRDLTGQSKGAPVSPLMGDLAAKPPKGVRVVPLEGGDLLEAFAVTFDAVRDNRVRHHVTPPLDQAAATAATSMLSQGAKVLDLRASPGDAAPLNAWMSAYWLLVRRKPPSAPPPPLPAAVASVGSDDAFVGVGDIATLGF